MVGSWDMSLLSECSLLFQISLFEVMVRDARNVILCPISCSNFLLFREFCGLCL